MLVCLCVKAIDEQRSITINVETDQMQKVAELLLESYLTTHLRQHVSRRRVIISSLKRIAAGTSHTDKNAYIFSRLSCSKLMNTFFQ